MSTAHIVSLDEHLSSDQYARCEYDSGVVTKKPLPDWNRSKWLSFKQSAKGRWVIHGR